MKKNIALIWGDCSSPEIVTQAVRVMDKIAAKYGHEFTYTDVAMGGEAIDKYGDPLPAFSQERMDKELKPIIRQGYDVMYKKEKKF